MDNETFGDWKLQVYDIVFRKILLELEKDYVEDMFTEECSYHYAAKQLLIGIIARDAGV